MQVLTAWSPVIFAVIAVIFLSWIRKGHGGRFGEIIRDSDWRAWKHAVERRERELEELRRSRNADWRAWKDAVERKECEFEELCNAEPNKGEMSK